MAKETDAEFHRPWWETVTALQEHGAAALRQGDTETWEAVKDATAMVHDAWIAESDRRDAAGGHAQGGHGHA